ncbi:MAG: hypothetical protein WC357_08990, partial [Candidatus Omnitrophota bacterium]
MGKEEDEDEKPVIRDNTFTSSAKVTYSQIYQRTILGIVFYNLYDILHKINMGIKRALTSPKKQQENREQMAQFMASIKLPEGTEEMLKKELKLFSFNPEEEKARKEATVSGYDAASHNFSASTQLLSGIISVLICKCQAAKNFFKAFALGYKVALFKLAEQNGIRGAPVVRHILAFFYPLANSKAGRIVPAEYIASKLSLEDAEFLNNQIDIHEQGKNEIAGLKNQYRSFAKTQSTTVAVGDASIIDGDSRQPLLQRTSTGAIASIIKKILRPVLILAAVGVVVTVVFVALNNPALIISLFAQVSAILTFIKSEIVAILYAFAGVNLLIFGLKGLSSLIDKIASRGLHKSANKKVNNAKMADKILEAELAGKPAEVVSRRLSIRENLSLLIMQYSGNKNSAKYQMASLIFIPLLRPLQNSAPAIYPFASIAARFIGDIIDLILILPILFKFALRFGFIRFDYVNKMLNEEQILTDEELRYLARQAIKEETIKQKLSIGRALDKRLVRAVDHYNGGRRQKVSIYALATLSAFWSLTSTRVMLKLISAKLVNPILLVLFAEGFLGTTLFTIPALSIFGVTILAQAMPVTVLAVLSALLVVLILDLFNGATLWHSFMMNREQKGTGYALLTLLIEVFEGVEGMVLVNSEIDAAINFSSAIGNSINTGIANMFGIEVANMPILPGNLISSPVLVMEQWVYGAGQHLSLGDAVWNPIESIFGKVVLGRSDFELGQEIFGFGRNLLNRQDLPATMLEAQSRIESISRGIILEPEAQTVDFNNPKDIAVLLLLNNPKLIMGELTDADSTEIRDLLVKDGMSVEMAGNVLAEMNNADNRITAYYIGSIQASIGAGLDSTSIAQTLLQLDSNTANRVLSFFGAEFSAHIGLEIARLQAIQLTPADTTDGHKPRKDNALPADFAALSAAFEARKNDPIFVAIREMKPESVAVLGANLAGIYLGQYNPQALVRMTNAVNSGKLRAGPDNTLTFYGANNGDIYLIATNSNSGETLSPVQIASTIIHEFNGKSHEENLQAEREFHTWLTTIDGRVRLTQTNRGFAFLNELDNSVFFALGGAQ